MNPNITPRRMDEYLDFLTKAIAFARRACWNGDTATAEAILDACHNLPAMLSGSDAYFCEDTYFDECMRPRIAECPELAWLARVALPQEQV